MTGPILDVRFDSTDPVLCSIAQELTATVLSKDSLQTTSTLHESSRLCNYEFQLQSFLTRPTTCKKLFPAHVQKKRYQRITVQERLILVSVGPKQKRETPPTTIDAISSLEEVVPQSTIKKTSPPQPQPPSRPQDYDVDTYYDIQYELASHHPAPSSAVITPTPPVPSPSRSLQDSCQELKSEDDDAKQQGKGAVLVAGLEVLEYLLIPLNHHHNNDIPFQKQHPVERIVYVAKVDTSGCWPLPELDTRGLKSPTHALVRGYLKAMRSYGSSAPLHNAGLSAAAMATLATTAQMSSLKISSADELVPKKTSLYIFARAQPQYLFAESAKNTGKHVLDDRGLVRWWKNMVASVYSDPGSSRSPSSSAADTPESFCDASKKSKSKLEGYWHIPGIETERQAINVIQSPSSSSSSASTFNWIYGHPDKGSKEMAHTLIPQFPDDPKSRIMTSPSCSGGFVPIDTFWELAAIGEESGAGKITGFFRVTEEVEGEDKSEIEEAKKAEIRGVQEAQDAKGTAKEQRSSSEVSAAPSSSVTSATSTAISETITIATATSIGGSEDAYTKVINYLLKLDFSTLEKAQDSTRQWRSRVESWVEKTRGKQQQQQRETEIYLASSALAPPSISISTSTSISWIQTAVVVIPLRHADETQKLKEEQEQPLKQDAEKIIEPGPTPAVVHMLGAGLIKRKTMTSTALPAAAAVVPAPVINTLSAGLIKRKTTTVTASTPAPAVNVLGGNLIKRKEPSTTTTESASDPNSSTAASTPAINVLDASLIKRRKVDS